MELEEGSSKNSLGLSPKPQTFIRPKNRSRLRNPYAATTPSTILSSSTNNIAAAAAALPEQSSPRNVSSQLAEMNKVGATSCNSTVPVGHAGMIVDLTIQQKKKHAIAHAQQDGCTGNFKSFDSPYGNFLVPVIPTLADLNR